MAPVKQLTAFIENDLDDKLQNRIHISTSSEMELCWQEINPLLDKVSEMTAERLQDQTRLYELNLAKKRAELSALQSQINPHFLYNTLDCMKWLGVANHVPQIAAMSTDLAALLRAGISGSELIPLEDELELVRQYLNIQEIRFEDRFVCEIDVDERFQHCIVPKMVLQPLVENAIFHGLEPKGGHGSVLLDISTDPDTGDVLLRITDDGVGMPPEQVAHLLDEPAEGAEKAEKFRHVGLWNVNRRIRYSFGEGYGLTIESEEDVGTEVTIRLPYQQKGDSHAADITGG